ncbi:hypothetical protein EDD70_2887 [Hydrogenoanaerobacterium saccharovorans]|uniref:Uncharacterized protein n=1 Tax=Hydrogenoanaerobacterium saccharovorans TaxID=474960 RepID=A0A1H8EEU8_9FIRM|nr:hypothetical protein [Hydrogenoanaerobacterium saccharovorans]RPF42144.1 hypothetical protein EDD70_2887 [Hydrogenoanaerobacterium saccharovorans]SEN18035.1 hypothetical protein SAMN05216180_2995 [Hydrogenoanaerobacterium saccharovorans]
MERFKCIWTGLFCLCGSYYLTWYIDKTTLETLLQRIFVFIYFLIILGLLAVFWFRCFKLPKMTFRNKTFKVLLSIIVAVVTLTGGFEMFIGRYQPMNISVTALGQAGKTHEEQKGTEVWINQILVKGKTYDLSQVPLTEGWEYREGVLLSYQNQPNTLKFQLPPGERTEISFISHPWSGEVVINNGIQEQKIDLYSSSAGEQYTLKLPGVPKKIDIQGAIIIFSCFLLICTTTFFLIVWVVQTKSPLSIVVTLLILYFIISSLFEISTLTRIVLLLLTIACGITLSYYLKMMQEDKKQSKLYKVMLILVTLYSTFAFVGHQLFMAGDLMIFTLVDAAKFMLVSLFIFPFICNILYLFEKANKYFCSQNILFAQKQRCYVRLISFAISFSILVFTALSCYPANITSDGIDQWLQAKGLWQLSNAHPFVHTFLLRVCSTVWDNPFLVVILQIAAFAGILSSFLTILYEHGLNKHVIFVISALLSFLPNNLLMVTLISKNIPFALAIWWLMILMIRLFENPHQFFHKPSNYIQMILSISLIDLLRHNGFLAVYSTLIMLVFVGIKYRKQIKGLVFIVIIGVVAVLQVVKGPVATTLSVGKSTFVASSSFLSPLGAALKYKISLPDDIISTMEKVSPLEQWVDTYDKYNLDLFHWSQPRPNFQTVSTEEAFSIYIKMLFSHPEIIIKDRLDHIDLIWNVSRPRDNWYGTYAVGMHPPAGAADALPELLRAEDRQGENTYEWYYHDNFLTKPLNLVLALSSKGIFEVLIWRNGIYIALYFLTLLFSISRKQYKTLLISMPALITLITLVLVMGWQIYQYLWFFPFSVIMLMLHAIMTSSRG